MKTKKFEKKLNLNKKTISSLEVYEMKNARGAGPSGVTCPQTCDICFTPECTVNHCTSRPDLTC